MPKNITIIKASGEKEEFDPLKVASSLKRSGAERDQIKKVLKELMPKIHEGMTTHQIYKIVYDLLAKIEEEGPSIAGRYSLKKAISELGPTGYPFEKFVAGIFSELNYKTETNVILEGNCVSHEVDILAKKEDETAIMEAKFHKRQGYKTNIKTALYIYARFLDIKSNSKVNTNPTMWLVTNTKVTSEVKKYCLCTGLKVLSWSYPKNKSLSRLIDNTGLHPITAIHSLDTFTKDNLLRNGIIFCKDIEGKQSYFRNEGIYKEIVKEANLLCKR